MSLSQSTPSTRLHGLDTLRAAAILAVVLYHLDILDLLPPSLSPVAEIGWIGVDLFFVLSGFLIGSQLLKPYLSGKRPSLRDFYTRRAYRILPAFFVVLCLYIFVPLWREYPSFYAPWQYATFTWNLLQLDYPHSHAFSHIWSLCVEEHFYLIFPLLLFLLMRRPSFGKTLSVLLLLVVGGIGLRAWILHAVIRPASDAQGLMMMKYAYYPTYTRLDGLVTGVSLSILQTRVVVPLHEARLAPDAFRTRLCHGIAVAMRFRLSQPRSPLQHRLCVSGPSMWLRSACRFSSKRPKLFADADSGSVGACGARVQPVSHPQGGRPCHASSATRYYRSGGLEISRYLRHYMSDGSFGAVLWRRTAMYQTSHPARPQEGLRCGR